MSSSGTRKRPKGATNDDDAATVFTIRHQPNRAVKRPRLPDPVPRFPPEIWEYIFRYVSEPRHLLRLRLVCQCWRDVIAGSPTLMGRFNVRLVGDKRTNRDRIDGAFVPAGLPPLVVKVTVRKYSILTVDGWWADVGLKLRELRLECCRMALGVLYGMLRATPNLKVLVLDSVKLSGTDEPDFQLGRMESLTVCHASYEGKVWRDCLAGFERLFPRLEELTLNTGFDPAQTDILHAIRTLQTTLKHLDLPRKFSGAAFLAELGGMQQLRLKSITLENFPDELDQWTRFCRMQPQLEMLTVTVNNTQLQMLNATGQLLPRLKSLSLTVIGPLDTSFLATMPALESLAIDGQYQNVSFLGQSCPNLLHFTLSDVQTRDVLPFLQRSPKLERLALDDCQLGFPVSIATPFTNLRHLTLNGIQCPNAVMCNLLRNCTRLEQLHLAWLKYLDDGVVRVFCQQLKRLRKLTMLGIRCTTAEACASYIVRHCRKLEELCADFADAELERIERARKVRIKRRVVSDTEEDDDDDEDGEGEEFGGFF
ncbi:uncharacterized protein LOC6052317 isoform X1 [Culex quinquefasciatus]|uniref:uncharacterized protein LOC6052317 isoform X1 n=1 Tax=Culex quinquefasciatus TaxID=7176 RepID=UPI0018E2CEAB|nr:uncharacterized protein LOC6052317 isoform X1 [Culex quinquefasciatus]